MTTPKGMYELKAVKGRELVELVNMFISGLKKRSVYAVAIQDLIRQGASFTVFLVVFTVQGDYSV